MKKIFNILLIVLILNISTIFGTPNRNQFKPMTVELDNESVAVISCRLIDYKGDCLKSDLIVNTPNGYTAPIDINEQQGGDKAIKLLAVTTIENGISVVTYNEKEELGLAQYIYDSNAKTLNRITYFNLTNTPANAITLDISSRSSQLDYNNNQFFIILSTNNSSYFITADNNDFIYVYSLVDVAGSTDMSTHKLDYIAGNEEGTFTVVSYNRTCTPATNIYVNLLFINIDINTKIINVNSYSYLTASCPNVGSTMLKYVSQSQVLYTSSFLNKTTVSLMDFPNSITFTFSRHKHFSPRDVQLLPLGINSVYNPSYVSSLTFDYSNINFRSTFSTFSFDGSEAVLSVERCCHGCYKNCFIEGHLLNIDLDNNTLSRKADSNGTFVDLPVVASTQLGFDRVRFDSALPLFRYNVLCMNTDLI